MKILASIQARMNSSRLPGKVLSDICGKPMLLWQIERIKRSNYINDIIVATSNSREDDTIINFCKDHKINFYRGSENDVLSRISSMLKSYKYDVHVECFGDSPFIDPKIIDEFIIFYFKQKNKDIYISSALKTTYPPGTEVTLYNPNILIRTNDLVRSDDKLREHAGYNISRFPNEFKIHSMEAPQHFNYPDLYLEVDVYEDLVLIRQIAEYFISKNKNHFSLIEILNYLKKNIDITKKNKFIDRRWKKFRKI
tara:strand:- start:36 stop:794 length:759 start_codon:yes stop_codon:yes gene_type:complete